MRNPFQRVAIGLAVVTALGAADAAAQLDPLLPLKRTQPNVLIAVDTADRMQRDVHGDYRDANVYRRLGGGATVWEDALKINDLNTATNYRRKYVGLRNTDFTNAWGSFATDHVEIVGDRDPAYATFDGQTRIAIARRSVAEAVTRNSSVARFGLLQTRQQSPAFELPPSAGADTWAINRHPVYVMSTDPTWADQLLVSDGPSAGWRMTLSVVTYFNELLAGPVAPLVRPDATASTSRVLDILGLSTGASMSSAGLVANSLVPAGWDYEGVADTPVTAMLEDLRSEASRLIAADTDCRNTVAIMILGGAEGYYWSDTSAATAATFLSVGGHRVPVYVIAIAPIEDGERTRLRAIASASGGRYTEITADMVAATRPGEPIPELVRAVNVAVSHSFATQADFDRAPDGSHPYGYGTEHQVTSPIVGTVDLEGARDITGAALPNSYVETAAGVEVPQRANVLLTAGYALPGFDGKLRAFRMHKPVADASKPSGYKFVSDGTRLWVGDVPAAAARNIYTALPNGTMVPLTSANASLLQPYLRVSSEADAASLIEFVRAQPLGAIVGSTPAIMDVPSLDPPPDADYPGFADAHAGRRGIVWVGANDGMLHGIDARLGREVWAFVPFNLLPKLRELPSGQPVGDFRYFVDGSPKVADVKVGGKWRTYLVMGEGAGGTFYQTFDVTLDEMDATVSSTSDDIAQVLAYFASPTSVPLRWAFPQYSHFDVSLGVWGDVAAGAPAASKTVGETWSDPAVGQIGNSSSPYVVLTGSGFLKYSVQQQANRAGTVAGTTFYVLSTEDGTLLDSHSVGSDGQGETIDNCASLSVNDCRRLKNALQADPVASGTSASRFITKVYLGDLDGKVWRFDLGLGVSHVPTLTASVSLYTINTGSGSAADHPVFSSMATVNLSGVQQYLFLGTGSDLLPRNQVSTKYALLVVLDQGASGSKTAMLELEKTDGVGNDEKVSSFPAAAGDIVFFSTTTYKAAACSLPDANLYGMTFIGGPAYDTNGNGSVTGADSQKLRTTIGTRGTAPFITDQHLVFGTGSKVEVFGDPEDFNNGVGQVGVRILSWREGR